MGSGINGNGYLGSSIPRYPNTNRPLPLWEVELMETFDIVVTYNIHKKKNRFPYGKWN